MSQCTTLRALIAASVDASADPNAWSRGAGMRLPASTEPDRYAGRYVVTRYAPVADTPYPSGAAVRSALTVYASRNSRRHTSNVRASERKSFTTTGTPNSHRPVGQLQVRVADAGCGQAYAHLSAPGLGSPPAGAGLRNAKFAPPPRPSAQISWLRPAGSRLAGRTGYRACRW